MMVNDGEDEMMVRRRVRAEWGLLCIFIREWQRHVISTEAIQQHLANTRTTLFPQWITLGQPLGKFELLRIIVVKVTNRPTHLAGHIIRDGDVGE